jgi:hypothetical protein
MAHVDGAYKRSHSAAEILVSFLAIQGISLPHQTAQLITSGIEEDARQHPKDAARSLAARLSEHSIHLKHTNALQVISEVLGHSNWMRVIRDGNLARVARYEIRFWQGGVTATATFDSIGQAVRHLIALACEAMPPDEPALCEIHKKSSLLRLELWHATTESAALYLERIQPDDQNPYTRLIPFEDAHLRVAVRRIIRSLERMRPAMLIDGGTVSDTLHSMYTAFWYYKSKSDAFWNGYAGAGSISERELFRVFSEISVKALRFSNSAAYFEGESDVLKVKQVWRDHFNGGPNLRPLEQQTDADFEQLFARYSRWVEALPCPSAEAFELIFFPKGWRVRTDTNAIDRILGTRNISLQVVAKEMEVPYRAVVDMSRHSQVSVPFLLKLGEVLGVYPGELQNTDGGVFPIKEPDWLMYFMDDAHELREELSPSLSTADVRRARHILQDVRNLMLAGRELSKPNGSAERDEENPFLLKRAKRILNRASGAGICLFGRRETDFRRLKNTGETDFTGVHVFALFVEPKQLDAGAKGYQS